MSRRPQVAGSSKARRSATLTAPSTIEARTISIPPCSRASGGISSSSNFFDIYRLLLVADAFDRFDDFRDARQSQLFEIGRIGHRHVLAGHPQHGRIEIVEGIDHQAGDDLGADA